MFTLYNELKDFNDTEYKLLSDLDAQSQHANSTGNFLEGNAYAISQHIDNLKAEIMSESLEDRRNKARALELEIYQMQVNGRAHGEHYDLGYLTQWEIENPKDSAFKKEVNKIVERKQSENGRRFAESESSDVLKNWLIQNPGPSPFRTSVENVYKAQVQDLRYCGEQFVIHNSFEALEEWLQIHTGESPFRHAVVTGLQGRHGAYTAEHVLVTLGAIQGWLHGNSGQSQFRYGIEQVFWRKQSESGRRFAESNIINDLYVWMLQNPWPSHMFSSVEQVYREKIIEDLLIYDGSKSDAWWNNPDAQLEYFYRLLEELGHENILKALKAQRNTILVELSMVRAYQQECWRLSKPQQNFADIDQWRDAIRSHPSLGGWYKNFERELLNWEEAETSFRRHRDNKQFRSVMRSFVGIGAGAFVSSLIPGLGTALLPNIVRGAVFGATYSAVIKGNIAKGMFQGALFSGLENVLGQVMNKVEFLKEAHRVQGFIQAGTIGALNSELNGVKVFKNMLISMACQGVTQQFENLTNYERAFMKSVLATILKGGDLGMALMAGSIGVLESAVQDSGETLGDGIRQSITETQENGLVVVQNTEFENTHTQNSSKNKDVEVNLASRLKRVKEAWGTIDNGQMVQNRLKNPTLTEQRLTFAKQQFSMTPERIQTTLESVPLVGVIKGGMKCTTKNRLKKAQLPNEGKIRFVPPENYHPSIPLHKINGGYRDKFENIWKKGPSRTTGEPFEWDVQLSEIGKKQLGWASRDENHINVSIKGHITHK